MSPESPSKKRKLETPASRKPLNHPSARTSVTEDARRAIQQVQTGAGNQDDKNKKKEVMKAGKRKAGNNKKDGKNKPKEIETIGIVFVDQTRGGDLAKRLQQAED